MEPEKAKSILFAKKEEIAKVENIWAKAGTSDVLKEDKFATPEMDQYQQKLQAIFNKKSAEYNDQPEQKSAFVSCSNANENKEIKTNCEQQTNPQTQNLQSNLDQILTKTSTQQVLTKQQTTKKSFRFKLMLCTYALAMTICFGWVIGNAIAINNQANKVELATQDYELSVAEYALKIYQIGQIEPDKEDTSLSPITDIIPIAPKPLESPTQYTPPANWFDRFCNWLSNLF
ncbi:MAG: hypothetical protein RR140_03300 [Clostridia bacterium]